ncbi:hypothetical protein GRI40_10025 [Altererythrobacter aerius]|uniref:Transferrin-binding protein B C-lobe/N-lobe beta barrel domain-containing protein n=1 Tax=Tsuneonella aeria TaxID=1837929 RepID=A0A6I4TEQ8_9SPHN|nr:transferrin-binding protein-like solute binding protein [Tsuneonella aeria]MXO75553.1 hypothetical protein [Tsuneonella aeria]
MRRKIGLMLSAAVSCALLAGCFGGGDDDSSPAPTPTPSPTASPSPTPTPAPVAIDFDFSKAFTDTATNASYIFAYFTPTGGAEVWSDGMRRDGQSGITYAVSPESVAFSWPDSATLSTFGAADRQTDTATRRTYRKGNDGIVLERPFQHVLRVTYHRIENFVRESVNGTLRSNRVTLFFNEVSTTSAITSNLSYTGTAEVAGGKPGAATSTFTASPSTFTVTASDKKLTGSIQILETVNGVATVRAVLPISATLSASEGVSGAIDDTANGFKGTFVGALAGPSREEMVLIFNVAHTDGREFIGSVIAS